MPVASSPWRNIPQRTAAGAWCKEGGEPGVVALGLRSSTQASGLLGTVDLIAIATYCALGATVRRIAGSGGAMSMWLS